RTGALAALVQAMLAGLGPPDAAEHARRAEEARACAVEALALLDAMGGAAEGEAIVRLAFCEAAMAAGKREAARGAIADARARLEQRAASIEDLALRESFLTRVAEHARTLELSRAWSAPVPADAVS